MRVVIADDFDLEKIIRCGQCFRARRDPDGSFRFVTGKHALRIRRIDGNEYEVSCGKEEWGTVWGRYFDLGRDYRRIRESIPATDGFLTRAAEAGKGIRILRQDPWEMLVTFIISQRKNIPAISAAVNAIAETLGEPVEEGMFSFPDAGTLRAAGRENLDRYHLGYRAPYVWDATERTATGILNPAEAETLSDGELLETLMTVRGVGVKVANCVGLFAYGRTGLAPVDVWIQRVIDREYAGENPFPTYGNDAGIMQQYAFYFIQHLGGEIGNSGV